MAFAELVPGHESRGECEAGGGRGRRGPACLRRIIEGTLYLHGQQGPNAVFFAGQLSRHRWLPTGRYVLRVVAIGMDGRRSNASELGFTIAAG
jgi:hypothetical protein